MMCVNFVQEFISKIILFLYFKRVQVRSPCPRTENSWMISFLQLTLELVENYIYLEQLIRKSGSLLSQINRRIQLAWKSFGLRSYSSLYLKKRIFDQWILPLVTYRYETKKRYNNTRQSYSEVSGTMNARNTQKGSQQVRMN